MTETAGSQIVLVDGATASALAQILPVLLVTLAVELRRTRRLRALTPLKLGLFFAVFGVAETVLVLSINGSLYPFQWFDICSALTIFGLLAIIFRLSLAETDEDGDA